MDGDLVWAQLDSCDVYLAAQTVLFSEILLQVSTDSSNRLAHLHEQSSQWIHLMDLKAVTAGSHLSGHLASACRLKQVRVMETRPHFKQKITIFVILCFEFVDCGGRCSARSVGFVMPGG